MTSLILPEQDRLQALAGARVLRNGLHEITAELRLIDAADLIAFIRLGQLANIGDLVNSSAELFFKQGTLSFGWSAEAQVRWDRPPKISLDMEFRHMAVTVFFSLTLHARHGTVVVSRIMFEDAEVCAGGVRALSAALADAKLPVPKRRQSIVGESLSPLTGRRCPKGG